jgi:hypothetical protein
MQTISTPTLARPLSAIGALMDPAYLREAMAEGPAGASGPDPEAKARLLSIAALVLCLPLVMMVGMA